MKDKIVELVKKFNGELVRPDAKDYTEKYFEAQEEGSSIPETDGLEISVKYVEGGHEGAGEVFFIILEVKEVATGKITHWEIPGWYQSYNGAEYTIEDMFQVKPAEKTIIVWNKA